MSAVQDSELRLEGFKWHLSVGPNMYINTHTHTYIMSKNGTEMSDQKWLSICNVLKKMGILCITAILSRAQ